MTLPQTLLASVEHSVINTAHPQSTRQLPGNRPAISAESYSTNMSGSHPQKLIANKAFKLVLGGVTAADPLRSLLRLQTMEALCTLSCPE